MRPRFRDMVDPVTINCRDSSVVKAVLSFEITQIADIIDYVGVKLVR